MSLNWHRAFWQALLQKRLGSVYQAQEHAVLTANKRECTLVFLVQNVSANALLLSLSFGLLSHPIALDTLQHLIMLKHAGCDHALICCKQCEDGYHFQTSLRP